MRITRLIITFLVLLTTPVLYAERYADFYVIPAVSHTSGANGTSWRSDVAIQNFQRQAIDIEMIFVASGESAFDNVRPVVTPGARITIAAGGSVLLSDVLGQMTGNSTGALLIGATAPFAVTSRTYSLSPLGGTVGQTIAGVPDFLESSVGETDNALAIAYVPGLIANARFRTNLGFAAATDSGSAGMTLEVVIRNGEGLVTGSRLFYVAPGTLMHTQFSAQSTGAAFDIGAAEFRIVAGDGAVVPYASVIDNASADAVFILGQFPRNAALPGTGSAAFFQSLYSRSLGRPRTEAGRPPGSK